MTIAARTSPVVYCTKCRTSLPAALFNRPRLAPCPICRAQIMVTAFPALLSGPALGKSGEILLNENEASCFYHPGKKAVVPCDQCGRFLCALCDVQMGAQHLCPGCIDPGDGRTKFTNLDTRRALYDSLALYLAIRYWSVPTSLFRKTRAVWVFAVAIALVQIAFWSWVFFY